MIVLQILAWSIGIGFLREAQIIIFCISSHVKKGFLCLLKSQMGNSDCDPDTLWGKQKKDTAGLCWFKLNFNFLGFIVKYHRGFY